MQTAQRLRQRPDSGWLDPSASASATGRIAAGIASIGIDDLRHAHGQCAGLVENHAIDIGQTLMGAKPSLISMPRRNNRPEALVTTAGTASPSAHGQVMISTAAATLIEWRGRPCSNTSPENC